MDQDIKIRTEEVQEILSSPPKWIIQWGLTLIFIVVILIVSLSFLIRYPNFVGSTIIVTTDQPIEKVIARNSGAIDTLLVENEVRVKAGQALAILKNPGDFHDIQYLKNWLQEIDIKDELSLETLDNLRDLNIGELNSQYLDFEQKFREYYYLHNYDTKRPSIAGYENMLFEVDERLQNQKDQYNLLKEAFELEKVEIERYENLFRKGIISDQEFEEKRVTFLMAERNFKNGYQTLSQLREQFVTVQKNIITSQEVLEEEKAKYFSSLRQAHTNFIKAIYNWEYKYVLKASISGRMSYQEFWGENQHVTSGDVVFSVMPLEYSNLIGKIYLSSHSIGKVETGQKILIKLNSFPYQQYGMLIGELVNISNTRNENDEFIGYVSLPNGAITSYAIKLPIDKELIGSAEIITEDLSIAQRLFYNFKTLF